MGWFQNLINKIKGKKTPELPETTRNHDGVEIPNTIEQYHVNVSSTGQSKRSQEIEDAVSYAINGGYLVGLKNQFKELTPLEASAANMIGLTMKEDPMLRLNVAGVGGYEAILKRVCKEAIKEAKSYGFTSDRAKNYIPSIHDIVNKMQQEKAEEKAKEHFTIHHPRRYGTLNQLYHSAVEIAKSNSTLTPDWLLEYASKRGGSPIEIDVEDPYVEEVDVYAAMSIARQVANDNINGKDIEKVGGPAKLINEMSVDAKRQAVYNGYRFGTKESAKKAKDFLKSPKDILDNMPEIEEEKQMY